MAGFQMSTEAMETSHIKKVRSLLERRYELLFKRAHNRHVIAVENAADNMDEVRLAEEREIATRLLERDFADIRLVNGALARIKNRTYGLCLRCDETISLIRLGVMPHAAYCVSCQEAVKREGISEGSFHEADIDALVGQ